ncbi:MAG: hypothetical protein E7532_04890 [Ruminococcaceae bacterium]|nr:hypothetical protein [Oscillospiraceae bacterium]
MYNVLPYVIFLGVPVLLAIFFIISLVMFIAAKRANRKNPESYTFQQITTRKVFLIVSSVLFGIPLFVVVSVLVLGTMMVAYM